jgi:hypothetical protein
VSSKLSPGPRDPRVKTRKWMEKPAPFLEASQTLQACIGPAELRDEKIRKGRILLRPAERARALLHARVHVADPSTVCV